MPRSPREIDHAERRYPFCIVWTPIPCITWFLPFVGHMGIATSRGIIRDFAGSYYVSEDEMGFGWPTRVWQLDERLVSGGSETFDSAVRFASDEYKNHVHNIICDNCHSHVALALNEMKYGGRDNWNMVILAAGILFKGRSIGVGGFLKQWLPFLFICLILIGLFVLPSFI
ncbi:hypothetical protein PFISCL1PPCAC_6601 [Pristionchus fissidentatus]|uniref:Transmembrane protein 222 n=1 Tax=Pristionchus fissidentatus TaxID=1538716 RepID=A0AAV5V746_9BILA|nr:hypothetical protein PFISCL1PPCAC_6601 [Pristionchus fissidentatus]